jgi:hypothetical protein
MRGRYLECHFSSVVRAHKRDNILTALKLNLIIGHAKNCPEFRFAGEAARPGAFNNPR